MTRKTIHHIAHIALFPTLFIALLTAGCEAGGRGENRTIKEAAEIHREMIARFDSVYTALQIEKARVEKRLLDKDLSEEQENDYKSLLAGLNKGMKLLDEWDRAVMGVPGLDENPGGENSHHVQRSHEQMETLSDNEILEFQQAYRKRLDEVIKEINGLLTTIDLYEGNA